MDISTLSLVELQDLLQQIPAEIKKREEQDKQKVLDELKALAESRGFSLDSLVKAKEKGKVKAVRTVKAKYRNPANPEQTWTGRGRKPQWVAEWIAGGRSIDELAV
ncbi:H-NS histone family protein [Azospira inquinata]|uniref:H-NS histone family protein n=1 Tax=Azospira inquinata TaxID=2785627 RepID=A0A975SLQ9_9RHOO|nr:H-NS histone family protein [Azospira inquinata]QWT46020.1 H-NS histone family protein [Azospira inquinata]QWT48651.1 H-NS histone family protein [Azospira inquinata]